MIEVPIGEVASYTAAGVNIHADDEISQRWYEATVATYGNRTDRVGQLAVEASTFSSVRGFDLDYVQGTQGLVLVGAVDGVGTKTEVAERLRALTRATNVQERYRDHKGIPRDVVAMCADDLARDGVEPVGFWMLYDMQHLDAEEAITVTDQLADGTVVAAGMVDAVFMGGESASLGDRVGGYGDFNYNLGGFAIGVAHRDRIITGEKVAPGDSIMAIRPKVDETKDEGPSFRSNGFSLVRNVLKAEYGNDWHEALKDCTTTLNELLRPSTIFAPLMVDMNGGYDPNRKPKVEDIHGFVHVTGGGIVGKLQRILAINGHGAVIDSAYEPNPTMRQIQILSLKHKEYATTDPDAYQALNMGNELLAIIDASQESAVAETCGLHGKETRKIGEVTEHPGIELKSKGVTNPGEWIRFMPTAA